MAKIRSKGLMPIREYPTYQAAYELHPQGDITAEQLYVKTVLIITDWLKHRVRKKGGDPSFLDVFPSSDSFRDFAPEQLAEIDSAMGYDIKAVCWKSHDTWAVRVIEPSEDADNKSFYTVITVKKTDESVLLATRTVCREPVTEGHMDPEKVLRHGFISHKLMLDPDIVMTEHGISTDYPPVKGLITVNGKSNAECDALDSLLISSENRQYPVVLLTKEMAERLEEAGVMDKMLENVKCVSYIVILENSTQKVVRGKLGQDKLADDMASGTKAAVIKDSSFGYKVDEYEIFDEEGELRLPYFNGMCSDLQNNTRNRSFDYHDIEFYSEVRQKKLIEALPRTEDPEKSAEIAAVIEGMQDELDAKEQNEELLLAKIAELEKAKKELENRNIELYRTSLDMEKLKSELEAREQDIKVGAARIAELDESLSKEKAARLEFIERTKALLKIPVKCTREELVTWIRDNYSDRLVLHERGERSFLADTKPRDLNRLCRIIHYLYGYTLCMEENQGDINAAKDAAKAYDLLDDGFDVTFVGKEPLRHYPDDYTIDISVVNPNKKNVLMDKHIAIGKGLGADSVRVYLYYDSEIGKSIIGHVYGHLEIGMK